MIYGLYHSAAGMMTSEYRQNVIANNLANADTVGFKQEVAVFAERRPESVAGFREGPSAPDLAGLSGGLWLGRTHTEFDPGRMQQTGHELDVAIDGPGFFVVELDGRPLYTRDGRFQLDASGQLRALSDGAAVLGAGGKPIRLNRFGGTPTIDEFGSVLQDNLERGRLAVADFEDYRGLRQAGAGRFEAGAMETVESSAGLLAGYVENSGVEPVQELVSMIETSRAYETNARMISVQDQTVGNLISVLAR